MELHFAADRNTVVVGRLRADQGGGFTYSPRRLKKQEEGATEKGIQAASLTGRPALKKTLTYR